MASIWSGTIGSLRSLLRGGTFTRELTHLFTLTYGAPSPQEANSWEPSFTSFLDDVLPSAEFDSVQALVEMQMPVGAERADLVLLGGTPGSPRAYVLEFKLWSTGVVSTRSLEVTVPGTGVHQHPSVQALNYRGKLKLFHTLAADYDVKAAVYLPNISKAGKDALEAPLPADVLREAPLFARADAAALAGALRAHLVPCALDPDAHADFSDAPYGQTRHLFDVLARHAKDIAGRSIAALAESGIGLTQEQEVVVEEVLAAAKNPRGEVFVVQGGPGSGKTLLAVSLLLRALEQGLRCVLAIRNNRLQAILRRCFDASYRGASGTLMFFEVPRFGTGIGDAQFGGKFDLVICDEAQRMRSASMPVVLGRAPVSAIFLDETQRLNPPEEGTVNQFSGAAGAAGMTPLARQLTAAVRCRGGRPYMDWVEGLLVATPNAGALALGAQPWLKDYEFTVCDSVEEMRDGLSARRDVGGDRVAMVASFTESPGSQTVTAPDNLRVGYPLTSGWDIYRGGSVSLRWLMKPDEYVRFWMQGGSNDLDRVASIYGAQGFESDYVGVIWGRDLVFGAGGWELGPPAATYDTIDGLVRGRTNRQWSAGALELVRNRYRIFLTRGIKGTLVFFEDGVTRAAVRSILGT